MKVCEKCGIEISTRDGDNTCQRCEDKPRPKAKRARNERDAIMRDMGLTKVKGALGGTYWE